MPSENIRVLVTGGAGYLASWIVKDLLDAGHVVHATVRSLGDETKVCHLRELAAAYPGKLELFEADLTVDGSFNSAMAGCAVVIHTASPYFLETPKDRERQLLAPAHGGTLNVLASVNRTDSVKRVVLTSSIVALYNDACDVGLSANHTVQEHDTNPNADPDHNPYAYSKTIAEQAAWVAQRGHHRWDLVTIHPGAMFGPSLSKRTDATSVRMMTQFLNGSFRAGVPRLWLGVVDVRDVAAAHVQAALRPGASGRYILVAESLRLLDVARLLPVSDHGVADKLPKREIGKALVWLIAPLVGMRRRYVARNVGYPVYFAGKRSESELAIAYRTPAETFNDHIRQVVRDGLL